jgi:lysophospholipase L1-like esterase
VKDWEKVSADMKLELPAGWYQLEFRAMKSGALVATAGVDHVGVGEVFVTCGQSNSANHGQPPQQAEDERVSSRHFQTGLWQHADDPQPGASGEGGSPWALLGDLLVKKHDVPVGFICVGVGGTAVSYWTLNGGGYARLQQAVQSLGPQGCRAVLWHQGESDSLGGTSAKDYAKMLGETIAQSRKDAGWDLPWGVALASFHPAPEATAERQAAVVAGQRKVIATVPGVFQGPETDSYHTRGWLCDTVHFNAQGLAAHAQGWADAVAPILEKTAR